jgi:hypothetical protein
MNEIMPRIFCFLVCECLMCAKSLIANFELWPLMFVEYTVELRRRYSSNSYCTASGIFSTYSTSKKSKIILKGHTSWGLQRGSPKVYKKNLRLGGRSHLLVSRH